MKKIGFILLTLLLSITCIVAQDNNTIKGGNAKFNTLSHNFGKIAEEVGSATCEFVFTNTGDSPIIIQNISTSCGCTTPSYTKQPVLPGKTGTIKVSYSTLGRVGSFNKKITVFTNEPSNAYVLTISGEVLPSKNK